MAQAAFIAAKKAKSMTLAPGLYRKAEFYYLKAKSSYRRKYFNKAKQYAILSKKFSERAEFVAIKRPPSTNTFWIHYEKIKSFDPCSMPLGSFRMF